MINKTDLCRCGHTRPDHDHYAPGKECWRCGCDKWRFSLVRTLISFPSVGEPSKEEG